MSILSAEFHSSTFIKMPYRGRHSSFSSLKSAVRCSFSSELSLSPPLSLLSLKLSPLPPLFSSPAGVYSQAASAVSAMSTATSTASTDKILRFIWSTLLFLFYCCPLRRLSVYSLINRGAKGRKIKLNCGFAAAGGGAFLICGNCRQLGGQRSALAAETLFLR